MTSNEIFKPYAEVAFFSATLWKEVNHKLQHESDAWNKKILTKQLSTIKHLMDRTIRVTGDFVPVGISKRAKQHCEAMQLGDAFSIGWGQQVKFEGQTNRSKCKLKHEHKVPVHQLINRILDATNLEEVVAIFEAQEIVWVTKEEDSDLPRSNRPNPDQAYENAGIEVMRNPNPAGHLFK